MKRIFTFLVSVFAVTFAMAQAPNGVFAKATVAPVIDGVIDAVWAEATVYNIDKNFQTDLPTLGTPGQTTWQGLWTNEGVYILLKVTDNAFYPNYSVTPAGNSWDYDKPELYFDVNYKLDDALGAKDGLGHYQVAPGFTLDKNDGTPNPIPQTDGVIYAFMVTGSNYIAEYFVPFTKLLDNTKVQVDRMNTIGFDVTIIDRDPGDTKRNSAVWANTGVVDGSWGNMDACGQVTFAGATPAVMVDAVKVTTTTGKITTDKGTLQMLATIMPTDASNKVLIWTIVSGTAQCSITSTGLITAASNGTVNVIASTTDGSFIDTPPVTVTITGQTKIKYTEDTWNTNNIIKNWNFTTDMADWGGWVDLGTLPTAAVPVSVDGVAVMKVAKNADVWRYQHSQSPLAAEGNIEYTFKFKSWSTGTSPCVVDFESASNIETAAGGDKQVRYGVSTDKESNNKTCEWNYTATVIPSWFTFHVTFDKLMATTVQKLQWMLSSSDQTISLDSVLLAKTSDIALISGVSNQLSNSIKVYPNPVVNELTVSMSSTIGKVAIYNSLGQKMMEKVSTGNIAKFNVSSLVKGMYIVRLSDGTTQKFIK